MTTHAPTFATFDQEIHRIADDESLNGGLYHQVLVTRRAHLSELATTTDERRKDVLDFIERSFGSAADRIVLGEAVYRFRYNKAYESFSVVDLLSPSLNMVNLTDLTIAFPIGDVPENDHIQVSVAVDPEESPWFELTSRSMTVRRLSPMEVAITFEPTANSELHQQTFG